MAISETTGGMENADISSLAGHCARLKSRMVMLGFRDVDVRDSVVCGYRVANKAAEQISVVKADVGGQAAQNGRNGQNGSAAVWKLGMEEDDDLIDEDELLGDDSQHGVDGVNGAKSGDRIEAEKASSCGATKKACANCTCGRAEGKVTKLTKEMIENPQSGGCGSCSLGDAFRCAGCPYRGLPAFKPGEKIALPNDFLTDDLE